MPATAIKHQLTCPFELTSGSFLISRRRILVIPRNHLDLGCLPIFQGYSKQSKFYIYLLYDYFFDSPLPLGVIKAHGLSISKTQCLKSIVCEHSLKHRSRLLSQNIFEVGATRTRNYLYFTSISAVYRAFRK